VAVGAPVRAGAMVLRRGAVTVRGERVSAHIWAICTWVLVPVRVWLVADAAYLAAAG